MYMLSLSTIRRGLEGLLSKWSIARKEKVGGNLHLIINSLVFARAVIVPSATTREAGHTYSRVPRVTLPKLTDRLTLGEAGLQVSPSCLGMVRSVNTAYLRQPGVATVLMTNEKCKTINGKWQS